MIVETKYNIDEDVFVIRRNKIQKRKINLIKWDSTNGVIYTMVGDINNDDNTFYENDVFKTREELINTL